MDGNGQITSMDAQAIINLVLGKEEWVLTLNPMGGTVSQSSKNVRAGQTYGELPTPERSNYRFNGWFTPNGVQVTENSTVMLTADPTLYARWTYVLPPTYTVTFAPVRGTVYPKSKEVTQDETYGDLPTPTRDNYRFVGWFTSPDGGTQITSDTIVNLSGNQVLYARWNYVPPTYTVTFNLNGSGITPESKTVTQGKTYGDLPTPTRDNYRFVGWFTSPDGGTQITSGTTVNLSEDQTLYAHWDYDPPTPTTYTVTFEANGGGGSMPSRKVADDGEFVFPKCSFTPPTNLEFDGWLVNGAVYQPGDTVTLDADAVAVAQWYGIAVSDILPNWNAVTVQLSNEVRKPVSVVVCAYSDAGQMLSCAVRTIDSGATVDLKPDITGAAYLQAFLLSPDTSAPLCVPFLKNLA